MDKDIKCLKVVHCPYYPMSNKSEPMAKSNGIFVIVYSEEYDDSCVVPQNVLALKVTSSRPYTSLYVRVSDKTVLTYEDTISTFKFNKESYILGSHLITLPISDCVVLGELPLKESTQVLTILSKTFGTMIEQSCVSLSTKESKALF